MLLNKKIHQISFVSFILLAFGIMISCMYDSPRNNPYDTGTSTSAESLVTQWAVSQVNATRGAPFTGIAVGADGLYISGFVYRNQEHDFGNNVKVTGTAADDGAPGSILLMKYSFSGIPQWAYSTVSSGGSESGFNHVIITATGIFLSGSTKSGSFDYGNSVTSSGLADRNVLLLSYSLTGTPTPAWAQTTYSVTFSSYSSYAGSAVTSDAVYAVGGIFGTGTFNFGNSKTIAGLVGSNYMIALVKYNLSGTTQWVKGQVGGAIGTSANGIVAGSDGLYVAGLIMGNTEVDFGNNVKVTGSYSGGYSVLLIKYGFDGTAQWAKTVTGSNSSQYTAVSLGSDGIYVAGILFGNSEFNFGNNVKATGVFNGSEPYNTIIVKYTTDGTPVWAKTFASGSNRGFYRSVFADSKNVYASGMIYGDQEFGFGNGVTAKAPFAGGYNGVLVKFDLNGNAVCARTLSVASNSSEFYYVTATSDAVYVAGNMAGNQLFDFGNGKTVQVNLSMPDAVLNQNPLLIRYSR